MSESKIRMVRDTRTVNDIDKKIADLEAQRDAVTQNANLQIGKIIGRIEFLNELKNTKPDVPEVQENKNAQ